MLASREKAFLTLFLFISLVACDSGDKKSGDNKKNSASQYGCSPPQTGTTTAGQGGGFGSGQTGQGGGFGSGQTGQGGGFGSGQTGQGGGFGSGQTGQTGGQTAGQGQTGFSLTAGDLYARLRGECTECHNGTEASDFNNPTFVTTSGASILDRVKRNPTDEQFMPQNATMPVDFIAELEAWQAAGFPAIDTFDPAGTAVPGFPANNGGFGTGNQFGSNNNCPPSSYGSATGNGAQNQQYGQGPYGQGQGQGQTAGGFGDTGNTTSGNTQGGGTTF